MAAFREYIPAGATCYFPLDQSLDTPAAAAPVAKCDADFQDIPEDEISSVVDESTLKDLEPKSAASASASPSSSSGAAVDPSVITPEKERELLAQMGRLLDEEGAMTPIPGDTLPADATSQQQLKRELARRRFLRARKHDVPAAVAMYKAAMQWRADNNVDYILDKPDPVESVFQCVCSHRHWGSDKQGHPVYYEKTGRVKVSEFLKEMTEDDMVHRHIRQMEYAMRRCEYMSMKHGRNIEKIIMIHDLEGLSMKPEGSGLRVFKRTTRIDQDYYPERLHQMILINAPLSFRGVWALIRPWIDPKTSAKVLILGSNCQEQLREIIPLDHLPVDYGGECAVKFRNGDQAMPLLRTYPDPNCTPAWYDINTPPAADEDVGEVIPLEEGLAELARQRQALQGQGLFGSIGRWFGRK